MNNVYAVVLTGAALLFSAEMSIQAQSKTGQAGAGQYLTALGALDPGSSGSFLKGGAPPNDLCSSVTPQALATGGSLTFTGDNTGATMDGDYEAGSGLETAGYASVWHAFTTTACANVTLSYCGSSDGFAGNFWIVISTACPAGDGTLVFNSNYNSTECANGTATINFNGLPAGTYYVPVLTDDVDGVVGAYSIVATAVACPAAPSNNACAGATMLTAGTVCWPATPFTTNGATQDMPPITCAGWTSANANDVFFSFVATATTHTIGVIGFNQADAVVELLTGPCADLTSLSCADATFPQGVGESSVEEIVQTGLTIGTTYYVRVYDYAHASPQHNFEICVTEGSGSGVGIEENTSDLDWSIFPNPANGVFNLRYNGANTTAEIAVIDVTGRMIRTERTSLAQGANHNIDLSGIASGNYIVRLTANGVRSEQHLMVK